jgi:hypothetical protein
VNVLRRQPRPRAIDWTGVPPAFHGAVSAVVRDATDAEQLPRWYGTPEWVPLHPVLLLLPTGPTLIGIAQQEQPMTACELRDQALVLFEQERGKIDTEGLVLWERGGPVAMERVQRQIAGQLVRQASAETW